MSDVATKNLASVLSGPDYALVEKAVPLFDSHDEYDKDGKLLRRFGLKELQQIARNCNNRTSTGDLAPWGPGHTKDDVKTEDDQPPVRGYYHNYRVEKYGPAGKLAVVADCYVQKRVELPNGKVVDGKEYARGLPRRSVELWPNSMTIDWIAHLRRSPQRDLGLLTNARDPWLDEVKRYSRDANAVSYSNRRAVVGSLSRSGKLRYSMESTMADEPMSPEAPLSPVDKPNSEPVDPAPEGHEDFQTHMDYYMKVTNPALGECVKKYQASLDSPTNQDLPETPAAPEVPAAPAGPEAFSRQRNGDVVVSRYQRELDDQKAQINALKRENVETKHKEKMARYERDLKELQGNGILLDLKDELINVAPLDEKGFERAKDRIKKNYQRDPAGSRLPQDFIEPGASGSEDPLTENAEKITEYLQDPRNEAFVTRYGKDAFYEAAKVLKYVK